MANECAMNCHKCFFALLKRGINHRGMGARSFFSFCLKIGLPRILKFFPTCPERKNGKSLALLINGLQLKNHKFVAIKRTSQEKMFKL